MASDARKWGSLLIALFVGALAVAVLFRTELSPIQRAGWVILYLGGVIQLGAEGLGVNIWRGRRLLIVPAFLLAGIATVLVGTYR